MTIRKITASTMLDLKRKLRAEMGWPDRRSWTAKEHEKIAAKYRIGVDHLRNQFVATPRQTPHQTGDDIEP